MFFHVMAGMVGMAAPTLVDALAPTAPAAQVLASNAVSASVTWTHGSAVPGTTYGVVVTASSGAAPIASGSGLGPWTWSVSAGISYSARITATAPDGQLAHSDALVLVNQAALTAPTPPAQGPPDATGTTSVSMTWTHAGAPGGLSYSLQATDLSDGSAVAPTSGSGLGPYVLPISDGKQFICTLTATRAADGQTATSGSYLASVEQDFAEAFPLESDIGWRIVRQYNLKAQGTQGPIPNGNGTITLGSDTIATRGATAGTGTFGVNNVAGLNSTDGLFLECLTTASMLPELTLTLPLGMTLSKDYAVRISAKVRVYNDDSDDSALFYIADPSVTPSLNVASTSEVGGWRILGQTATLTYRRGASAGAGITVPSTYASGSVIYTRIIIPGWGNDCIVQLDPTAYDTSPPAYQGRTQSGPAAPTNTASVFADGLSTIKLMIGAINGGSGVGTPKITVEEIHIEVR